MERRGDTNYGYGAGSSLVASPSKQHLCAILFNSAGDFV